jgi:hypothetical protein
VSKETARELWAARVRAFAGCILLATGAHQRDPWLATINVLVGASLVAMAVSTKQGGGSQ